MGKNRKAYPVPVLEWATKVAQMTALFYGSIPVPELYRVFLNGKDRIAGTEDVTEEEFRDMLEALVDSDEVSVSNGVLYVDSGSPFSTFRLRHNEAVINADDKMVRGLLREKKLRNPGYRILSYDEVLRMMDACYIETPGTEALRKYLSSKWKIHANEASGIIRSAFVGYMSGEGFAAELGGVAGAVLRKTGKIGLTQAELGELADVMAAFYNNCPQFVLYGWSPLEARGRML